MFSEPQKKQEKYFTKPIGKEQFAQLYGVTRKTILEWIKKARVRGLKVQIHKGKFWWTWEANEMYKHFSLPPSTDEL